MKQIIAILLFSIIAGSAFAQKERKVKLPSPEGAIYDNNGNDLRGFINKNKSDFEAKGNKVSDASGDTWAYIQARNVKTPGADKDGNRNYRQNFDVTLAMLKTKDGAKATWWTREYNMPQAKLLYYNVGDPALLGYSNVKYAEVMNDAAAKSFSLVEYTDTLITRADFEQMLKNCIFVKNGTLADMDDYKPMVEFYNGFLSKFTNVNDPVIDNKSFLTLFTGKSKKRYAGYFNVVNGKLSGTVVLVDAPFERDRIKFLNDVFHNLTGSSVHVYGDDYFDMEKLIRARAEKGNLKVDFRKTSSRKKFNEEF